MKKQLISIGKMAEINHTTVTTLRLYDEQGLLKPRFVDPQTGYRYYDGHQSARLDMISYMKELGMSLGEIASVLEKEDITLIEQILIQKNEQLHAQLRELRMRHNAVERATPGSWTAACTPASIWTAMTAKWTMPGVCGIIATGWATPSAGITSARL